MLSLRDGVTRIGSCDAFLHTRSERRLLPFIYPWLLCDGVTLRVECVLSHSIVTKSALDSWPVFLQDGVTPVGSGSIDLISNEGIASVGLLVAFFSAVLGGVFVSSFGWPVYSEAGWLPHSVVFASGEDSVCVPLANGGVWFGLLLLALLPLALPWGLVCFGGLAVIFSPRRFHALVFHVWRLALPEVGLLGMGCWFMFRVPQILCLTPLLGVRSWLLVSGMAVRALLQTTSLPLGMDVSPAPGQCVSVSTF